MSPFVFLSLIQIPAGSSSQIQEVTAMDLAAIASNEDPR